MSTPQLSRSEPALDARDALPLIQGLTHLHEAVLLLDREGRIEWMSDALASLCGGGRSFKGRPWSALLAQPADAPRLLERFCSVGRVLNEPVALRGRQDARIAASVSAARLGGEPGSGATVAILRLESIPPQARLEFQHMAHYLRAVLQSAPDGVVVVDRSRFITYANPAMSEVTGYAVAELVDKPLALFLHAQDDLERIGQALAPSSPLRNLDLEVRRKDGRALSVSVSVSLLTLPDGTHVGAAAYVRDVTGRRRFEQDLARKNRELQHYVDAISHDLRSPLVSLLGFTRLLQEDYGERLDEKGRHFLRRVEQAGRSMEELIRDLLELSRIARGGRSEDLVDPRVVMLQLLAELKPRLDAQQVDLEIPDNPPLVRCERTRLYRLLSCLVSNALDHMGPVEKPRVRVHVQEERDGHRISVADNGVGIDPAHHERIFQVFQSLAPRNGSRRGTGIGLAVVKQIAETEGGRAWVESEPGRGAAFHVSFPGA